ncbi:MAG: hypothetical protein M3Y57_12025 [Acidobacteriota bacterium]|nr:hypothetical protein [Acidobacteriota bacterium]
MKTKPTSICTEQFNIRLTAEEKKDLERRAKLAGVPLGTWGREQLLRVAWPPETERRRLVFAAMASENSRLTFVAAQDGTDLTSEESRERIERKARASAEALVDRWLGLNQPKGVA